MKNIELPQWAVDIAVEGLQELARRLEADACAMGAVGTPEAVELARNRLEDAKAAWRGHEFYIGL